MRAAWLEKATDLRHIAALLNGIQAVKAAYVEGDVEGSGHCIEMRDVTDSKVWSKTILNNALLRSGDRDGGEVHPSGAQALLRRIA